MIISKSSNYSYIMYIIDLTLKGKLYKRKQQFFRVSGVLCHAAVALTVMSRHFGRIAPFVFAPGRLDVVPRTTVQTQHIHHSDVSFIIPLP